MTRTRALTLSLVLQLCVLAGLLALLLVATAHAAPTEPCDPAYTAQCCACELSEAVEPAPLARIYLPTVQRDMPPMSSESTPLQPVPTVTPDAPVTGDVQ